MVVIKVREARSLCDYQMRVSCQDDELNFADGLTYFFVFPFMLWSFLGGHKQEVFGYNSDNIITAIALIFSFLHLVRLRSISKPLACSMLIFLVILFSMTISSFIFGADGVGYVIRHASYCVIGVACVSLFGHRVGLFVKTVVGCALASSLVVIVSVIFLGMGAWGRATIPVWSDGKFASFPDGYTSSSDPNVLSYFLFLGAIVTILRNRPGFGGIVAFCTIAVAAFLTLSRSGALSFVLAVAVVAVYAGLIQTMKERALPLLVLFSTAAVGLLAVVLGGDRIGLRVAAAASDSDRLSRLGAALKLIGAEPQVLLFGLGPGYSSRTTDPHNFYLSTMIDTGLVSLVGFILILVCPVIALLLIRSAKNKAVSICILIFFLSVSMFYWQIRFYYFVMTALLVFYISGRSEVRRFLPVVNT